MSHYQYILLYVIDIMIGYACAIYLLMSQLSICSFENIHLALTKVQVLAEVSISKQQATEHTAQMCLSMQIWTRLAKSAQYQ